MPRYPLHTHTHTQEWSSPACSSGSPTEQESGGKETTHFLFHPLRSVCVLQCRGFSCLCERPRPFLLPLDDFTLSTSTSLLFSPLCRVGCLSLFLSTHTRRRRSSVHRKDRYRPVVTGRRPRGRFCHTLYIDALVIFQSCSVPALQLQLCSRPLW